MHMPLCVCVCVCVYVRACVKKMTRLLAKLEPWTAVSALLGLISKVQSYSISNTDPSGETNPNKSEQRV